MGIGGEWVGSGGWLGIGESGGWVGIGGEWWLGGDRGESGGWVGIGREWWLGGDRGRVVVGWG